MNLAQIQGIPCGVGAVFGLVLGLAGCVEVAAPPPPPPRSFTENQRRQGPAQIDVTGSDAMGLDLRVSRAILCRTVTVTPLRAPLPPAMVGGPWQPCGVTPAASAELQLRMPERSPEAGPFPVQLGQGAELGDGKAIVTARTDPMGLAHLDLSGVLPSESLIRASQVPVMVGQETILIDIRQTALFASWTRALEQERAQVKAQRAAIRAAQVEASARKKLEMMRGFDQATRGLKPPWTQPKIQALKAAYDQFGGIFGDTAMKREELNALSEDEQREFGQVGNRIQAVMASFEETAKKLNQERRRAVFAAMLTDFAKARANAPAALPAQPAPDGRTRELEDKVSALERAREADKRQREDEERKRRDDDYRSCVQRCPDCITDPTCKNFSACRQQCDARYHR